MRLWTLWAPIFALALPAAAQQQDYRAADADRQAMLDRLGIREIRPGADGFDPKASNAANYDEARTGTPELPSLMRMDHGHPARSRKDWARRRSEIVARFDREIYGRVPLTAPKIRWNLVREEKAVEAGMPVVKRWLEGVADNRARPQASATLAVRYTLPAGRRRVPVMLSFGFPEGFRFPGPPRPADPGPPPGEQLLRRGWGHAVVVASSIQADNGGALKTGVIGIALRGRPRAPDDWGVLRAWAWGASRAREAIAADAQVDPRRIGIEGLSRYGKAALVAMAYDPQFAIGFVGSSGAGGAALYRRNFGERMGNLAASGEYHWFAGNFLKYAGPKTEFDLPIDAHMLIALVAPRPLFLGAGTVDTGDGWVDPKGSFLAAVAASPAWEIQGAKGLSATAFPPELTPVTGGTLAFRQHRGGHDNRDNWPSFIDFAVRELGK
ncbi:MULTISPECIES: acetylxylan esterase [unclassified Sphingomonas]|uniref:alpha/beta hydrolase family protein n=3 Tax=Pseudomonadota TaxID=1224 RepID=UPI0010F51425|nr:MULTISPECIES: acetylxylan esterase [unclassified Sphingomonas]